MQNYESNFWSTKQYTSWPFLDKIFDEGVILDFTIVSPQRLLLQAINYQTLTFMLINGDYYASVIINNGPGVYSIKDANNLIVGWIEIGKWIPITKTVNTEILYGINICWEPISGRDEYNDGYNCGLYVSGNEVNIIVSRGEGIGEYCGNERKYDGIYTINGISGNSLGNYKMYNSGYITFLPEENILNIDMNIPDDICTRPGNKGPQGPKGPTGATGKDGIDAQEIVIDFDPYCP